MNDNISKLDDIFRDEPEEIRIIKAKRTLQILERQGIEISKSRCLEIGTGSGIMSKVYEDHFNEFISVDKHDLRKDKKATYNFLKMDCTDLDFADESFDVVLFAHVFQYLPDKSSVLKEIHRILPPCGLCYFSTTNRFAIMEPHYYLPFLGYFPKVLANIYLRICTKNYTVYDIHSDNYFSLNKKLSTRFTSKDITVDLIKNYKSYNFSEIPAMRIVSLFPRFILQLLNMLIITNWIFILRKKD